MIDLNYTQTKFNEFIQKYDIQNNERIALKVAHMLRVMKINIQFAKYQNLNDENIALAGVIGLLHDVGRFVQVEKYNTFIDAESIDHCQAGVDLLFNDNLINFFVPDSKYHFTIKKAISNHGKMEIEERLDEITFLHCKLIRDSDKTDIYEIMINENPDIVFDGPFIPDANISSTVINAFYNHSMVKKSDIKTVLDDYVRKVAFIYNYYFNKNLKYIKEQNYINRMTDSFLTHFKFTNLETIKKLHEIREYGNNYLNNIQNVNN